MADSAQAWRYPWEQAVFILYLAILVWAPLPFGSNRVWAGALLCLLLCVTAGLWSLLALVGRARIEAEIWRYARVPLGLLVLVQLWVLVQLTPLPAQLVGVLSPLARRWHLAGDWITLSLDPAAAGYFLLRGCGVTLGFFLTVATVNSANRVRLLLGALVFSGTLQAVYGVMMVLSGLELGFFTEKYVGLGAATGTFVNSNHFAGYLVMCLAAGIGLLLSTLGARHPTRWRERMRGWLRLLLSSRIRLRIYLAVMVAALVMSHSRMGNVAFFLSMGLAGVLALWSGRRLSLPLVLILCSLFLVDMLVVGRWFGTQELIERLGDMGGQAANSFSRYWVNLYTLDYLRDFALTGSGGGSYYGVFPNYQGAQLKGYFEHAHNDYLEFCVELGIPAALSLAACVLLCLRCAYRAQAGSSPPPLRGAGFAACMAIFWALLHSLVDFNLQIPANALTFAVLLGLACSARGLRR